MAPTHVASMLWLAWYATWAAAALWRDRTVKTLGLHHEALSRALTIIGVVLLFFYDSPRPWRRGVMWDTPRALSWSLLVPIVLGFLFAWWARLHIGRLWSPNVARKSDHRIVDTGPYAVVRHPIYSSLILSAFSTAVMRGTLAALVGAAVFTLGFWLKARLEERFLRRELGLGYDSYARRVGMLLPFRMR